jgi:hypothetical protein
MWQRGVVAGVNIGAGDERMRSVSNLDTVRIRTARVIAHRHVFGTNPLTPIKADRVGGRLDKRNVMHGDVGSIRQLDHLLGAWLGRARRTPLQKTRVPEQRPLSVQSPGAFDDQIVDILGQEECAGAIIAVARSLT